MKKILIFVAAAAVFAVALAATAKLATANSCSEVAAVVDSINPMVRPNTIYVKTTKPTGHDDFGAPLYTQTAVDASGHKRPIHFLGMKQLVCGRYLALKTKGAYVETYEAVPASAVPSKAFNALQ